MGAVIYSFMSGVFAGIKFSMFVTILSGFIGFWSYFSGNDTIQVSADKWLITQIVHSAYNVGIEFAKQGSQHYEGTIPLDYE